MPRLFVYGTLLSGERNHRLLAPATFIAPGATKPRFELRDLGPYPALLRGGRSTVLGEVYLVDAELLSRLDRFEGHPDLYRRGRLTLASGWVVQAYVLAGDHAPGHPVIVSGSWRDRERRAGRR